MNTRPPPFAFLHASVLAAVLAFPCMPALAATQDQAPQIAAAAKSDFAQFVAHFARDHAGNSPIGFPLDVADLADLAGASLSDGFQVYTVDPKDLMAGRGDLSAMAKPSAVWRFMIRVQGRPVGLATVEQVDGKWAVVSYGAATLAQDADALMGFHGNAERSNVRFIRVYQAQSDFLEVRSSSGVRYAPLQSARQSLLLQQRASKDGGSADGLMDASELLAPLRAAVKANLDNAR